MSFSKMFSCVHSSSLPPRHSPRPSPSLKVGNFCTFPPFSHLYSFPSSRGEMWMAWDYQRTVQEIVIAKDTLSWCLILEPSLYVLLSSSKPSLVFFSAHMIPVFQLSPKSLAWFFLASLSSLLSTMSWMTLSALRVIPRREVLRESWSEMPPVRDSVWLMWAVDM